MYDQDGELYDEEVIEDVYKNNIVQSTNGKVHILKLPTKGKRRTDGWMNFKYTDKMPGFEGIQECKKGAAASKTKLYCQLAQAIKYYWEMCVCLKKHKDRDFKVFCLNSEKYFVYVYKDEIEDLLVTLNELFLIDDCAPNELANRPYKHKAIIAAIQNYDINYHICDMPTEVDLARIFREIYCHCL